MPKSHTSTEVAVLQGIAQRLSDLMHEVMESKFPGRKVLVAEFAEFCGIKDSSMRNYLLAKTIPGGDNLAQIALSTGVSVDWLLTGEGSRYRVQGVTSIPTTALEAEAAEDVVFIPFYDVSASAGGGAFVDEETERKLFPLSRNWIRESIGASLSNLSLIRVMGDSMQPTLDSGDMVLVDGTAKYANKIVEGIYVLRIDGYLRVKRLERLRGKIRVMSDNSSYRPEVYDLERFPDEFTILGKVVASIKPH